MDESIRHLDFRELGEHFIDPSFWQSLGKWDRAAYDKGFAQFSGAWEMEEEEARDRWKKEWHRFIDHLAEEKTAEDFFTEPLR